MSKSVSLTESVSTYVLAQLFKSYTQQQQLDFMEQVLNAEPNEINNLIVYMKDKIIFTSSGGVFLNYKSECKERK